LPECQYSYYILPVPNQRHHHIDLSLLSPQVLHKRRTVGGPSYETILFSNGEGGVADMRNEWQHKTYIHSGARVAAEYSQHYAIFSRGDEYEQSGHYRIHNAREAGTKFSDAIKRKRVGDSASYGSLCGEARGFPPHLYRIEDDWQAPTQGGYSE
jgi:hypothetical protein